jgi:hypothetical protein
MYRKLKQKCFKLKNPLNGRVLTLFNRISKIQSDAREVEFILVLDKVQEMDNCQVWFYRNDCLVNKEFPGIAIEVDNMLIRPAEYSCSSG